MKIDIHKSVDVVKTNRVEMLGSMFEVPINDKLSVSLTGEINIDRPYNIGLIVGPSGSGKTLLLNNVFGTPERMEWSAGSVIDDFPSVCSMEDISRICQAVGFNTIPAWLRPYSVLSNGEQFRVQVSRALLGDSVGAGHPVTIDEFTSVVDRQVAQFACHAIQRYVREKNKTLVVASCHYDIIDWLQPDWILEPGNPCKFTWRSLQRRPSINVAISRVKYETWRLFRDFHYMSQDLNKAARCYGLYVRSETGAAGLASQPHIVDIRPYPNRGGDNSGASTGLRLPTGSSMRRYEDHTSVVLQSSNNNLLTGESPISSNSSLRTENPSSSKQSLQSEENTLGGITGPTGCEDIGAKRMHPLGWADSLPNTPPKSDTTDSEPNTDRDAEDTILVPTIALPSIPANIHIQNTQYRITSMCGVLYRPHPRVSDIYGFTRMVTLPDFQGLGLAFVLATRVASAYKALGRRLHSYPNHPAWIRSYQRSKDWMQVKNSGTFSPRSGRSSTVGGFGGRSCAVFMYIGPAMNYEDAQRLINPEGETK
jgi:ABC-type lipoprotein export system ATPase subunit